MGTTMTLAPRQPACPCCQRPRYERRDCDHQFHDGLPGYKAYTP